jgi:hypothetical protein
VEEKLAALDAVNCHSESTGGRPSTLWSAIAVEEQQEEEGLVAVDEPAGQVEGT